MRTVRWGAGVGALVAALILVGTSCGDDDDDGQAAAPQADADPLNLEIQSVTLPPGDGARPVVRFRVTDQSGNPIDLQAEIGAQIASPQAFPNILPRFTLAQLDDRGNYNSYYRTTAQPAATLDPATLPPSATPPVPGPMTQATSKPAGAFPVDDLRPAGNGFYDFTLPPTEVTGRDRTKTHTLASWVERKRTALDSDIAHGSFNFVPEGGGAPELDQVVSDEGQTGCNRCHFVVQAHGTRRGTQLCITCHSPETGDPDTGRTVDFQVMIHKIHMGRDLPSVQKGNPYYIVGFRNSIHDWSDVAFPFHDGVQHCTACHVGQDADNWRLRPSVQACTSCHDNVKFAQTAGDVPRLTSCNTATDRLEDCLHTGGAITSDTIATADDPNLCIGCHAPGSGLAVERFHHGD